MSINTQFLWPSNFNNTIIIDNVVLPNVYSLNFSIQPINSNPNSITTGVRKLKFFIEYKLQNSIFIAEACPLVEHLAGIENNMVLFPVEPTDFHIGSILYNKFISITQDYFEIEFITIDSMVGDHVQYTIVDPEDSGLELAGNYWWNEDNLDTGSGADITWDDLEVTEKPKFSPTVIKGGLSEN